MRKLWSRKMNVLVRWGGAHSRTQASLVSPGPSAGSLCSHRMLLEQAISHGPRTASLLQPHHHPLPSLTGQCTAVRHPRKLQNGPERPCMQFGFKSITQISPHLSLENTLPLSEDRAWETIGLASAVRRPALATN